MSGASNLDALLGDLDAFRLQMAADAEKKKARLERGKVEQQQAQEGRNLRGDHETDPKLVQDALNLVIEAAVPENLLLKILCHPNGSLSFLDGSDKGQILILERLVNLACINKECYAEVLRIVGLKMKLSIRIWEATNKMPKFEHTLDRLLSRPNNIFAHVTTLEIQDRLCVDFTRSAQQVIMTLAQSGINPHTANNNGPVTDATHVYLGSNPTFQDRHLRRYTATFTKPYITGAFKLSDFEWHRWSLSHDLFAVDDSLQGGIRRGHSCAGRGTFQPKLSVQQRKDLRGEEPKAQGSLWELVEYAVHAGPGTQQMQGGIYGKESTRNLVLLDRKSTERLVEATGAGVWEEYEFAKETYAVKETIEDCWQGSLCDVFSAKKSYEWLSDDDE